MADPCPPLIDFQAAVTIPVFGPTIRYFTYNVLQRAVRVRYKRTIPPPTLAPVGFGTMWAVAMANTNREAIVLSAIANSKSIGQPTNFKAPAITGTPTVGSLLTVSAGSWCYGPTSFTYQWYRNGAAIGGATAGAYTIQSADNGATLTASVVATNGAGSSGPAVSNGVSIGGVSSGAILLETGGYLLLESGGRILLEA